MSTEKEKSSKSKTFIRIRTKLLVGFSLVFTIAFASTYIWFYSFATNSATQQITEDLVGTVKGATGSGILGSNDTMQIINGDELGSLINEVEPGPDGLTDDPRYWNQVKTLCEIRRIEPRASLYTYTIDEQKGEMIFITSWGRCLPDAGDEFAYYKQAWKPKKLGPNKGGMKEITFQDDSLNGCAYGSPGCMPTPYMDEFGDWISAFAPIRNSRGEVVAALGVDFEAGYVREVQAQISRRILIAFIISYSALLIMVSASAQLFARPIAKLTEAARYISEANYETSLKALDKVKISDRFPDEVGVLQNAFKAMVNKVYQREQSLRKTVEELSIQIDETKRKRQVEEIVDSEFFQSLLGLRDQFNDDEELQ